MVSGSADGTNNPVTMVMLPPRPASASAVSWLRSRIMTATSEPPPIVIVTLPPPPAPTKTLVEISLSMACRNSPTVSVMSPPAPPPAAPLDVVVISAFAIAFNDSGDRHREMLPAGAADSLRAVIAPPSTRRLRAVMSTPNPMS